MILYIKKKKANRSRQKRLQARPESQVRVLLCVSRLPGKTCILYSSLSFSVRSPWHAAPRSHISKNVKRTMCATIPPPPPRLSIPLKHLLLQIETQVLCGRKFGQDVFGLRALEPGYPVSNALYLLCTLGRVNLSVPQFPLYEAG